MPTNTYVALATQTLSSPASTITFSSIPQGYTDLVLVFQATAASANMNYDIRIGNGTVDSGSNYSDTYLLGGSGGAQSSRASNQDRLRVGNSAFIQSSGGVFTAITHFMNYSNTTTNKTMLSRDGNVNQSVVESSVGLWRSTAAINIITLGDFGASTMAAGTTASLYGIAAASVGAKATGGTIYSDSQYYYHVFGSTGTFTPSQTLSCDVLQVAGGGGSGYAYGGGGGAGGLLYTSARSFASAVAHTVTIGAGGNNGTNGSRVGVQGNNSTITGSGFSTLTAVGGGGGGANSGGNQPPTSGGSGGGASGDGSYSGAGGTATSGQGFAGGAVTSGNTGGSGGGGAGAVGTAVVGNQTGANGGIGSSTYSSWGVATGTGVLSSGTYYLAGGGAGSGGTGGLGGGANPAGSGLANTGGGGGTDAGSGAGGSGLTIVRYAK
jgi:hypothetical protein